ncbi:unnamed protein product [Brassicogethes aeneus]|uniref:superoxide dismutase n=1 Tax=Brassicogethes aeneus TaxID=1431903 RepID=A0A9P0FEM7_BRAAE|nr:unnamed protein product [Brassicogethes aeneus]
MYSNKIEFAVQMTCESCVNAVKKSVENVPGIKNIDVNLETKSVIIETNLPTLEVQKRLEESGRKVALRGYGGSVAGVTILEAFGRNVKGVIRFEQATKNYCIIDGTVDGLSPGEYQAAIHECGDISQGCKSVGEVYSNIGSIKAESSGRATFRLEDDKVKLGDVIGRSFVISEKSENGNQQSIACGVIARSAGLFENPKTICACDGVTIWNEKVGPKSTL